MHRVDDADYTTVGGKRRYKEDPPPGTVVGWTMMNALQEEIAGVIEDAGLSLRVSGSADNTADYASQLNDAIDDKIEDTADVIYLDIDNLQDQIDTNDVDITDIITSINEVVDYTGVTPDITDETQLINAVKWIHAVPTLYNILGFNISIRKDSGAWDDLYIKIDAGECIDGDPVKYRMFKGTQQRKRIDQSWIVGNGGGFPNGIGYTVNTTYSVFLIQKDDGSIDAGFDTSAAAVNLLAYANVVDGPGWIRYRPLGYVHTKPSGTGIHFSEDVRLFTEDTFNTRVYRCCFPLAVSDLTGSLEIMCEMERKLDSVQILFPAHDGTASGNALEYTFISSDTTPDGLLTNMSIKTPAVFACGNAISPNTSPGQLLLNVSPHKFIASVAAAGDYYMTTTGFKTGGSKGMLDAQCLNFTIFNNW